MPDGFAVHEYANDLKRPTALAFDDHGRLFVAEAGGGRVTVLSDENSDGLADGRTVFAEGLEIPLGLALRPGDDGRVYVSLRGEIAVLVDRNGDDVSDYAVGIILNLPHGLHQNNGIAFGPDGMLYITNGSTCNVCAEKSHRSAVILRSDANGNGLEVFARGLRNPYDIAFDPEGRLWATDNGPDPPEAVDAPDELNLIVADGHYGWPDCIGHSIERAGRACEQSLPPALEFDPHSSSDGIVYQEAEALPAEYGDSLFIAQWGNNEGQPEAGRVVLRVPVRDGEAASPEMFASGFSHPLAIAAGPDGALYVSDWGSGAIYRISWEGAGR